MNPSKLLLSRQDNVPISRYAACSQYLICSDYRNSYGSCEHKECDMLFKPFLALLENRAHVTFSLSLFGVINLRCVFLSGSL